MTRFLLVVVLSLAACSDDPNVIADAGADSGQVDTGSQMDASGDCDLYQVGSLQERLDNAITTSSMPAVAGVVYTSSAVVEIGVSGVRRDGGSIGAEVGDLWQLGSNTKAMTATMIARLVEEGVVSWDDRPVEVLGLQATADPAFAEVTMYDLLVHTAGFHHPPPADVLELMNLPSNLPDSRAMRRTVSEMVLTRPPDVTPGTYQYSNLDYMVAGAMVEELTGQDWEQLMQTKLFTPLGMESCGFGPVSSASNGESQPWPHHYTATGVETLPDGYWGLPASMGPAGTVHCSIGDFAKFLQAHLKRDTAFLTAESFDTLQASGVQTPEGPVYTPGWNTVAAPSWHDGPIMVHDGTTGSMQSVALLFPNDDLGVAFATNLGTEGRGPERDDIDAWLRELVKASAP